MEKKKKNLVKKILFEFQSFNLSKAFSLFNKINIAF